MRRLLDYIRDRLSAALAPADAFWRDLDDAETEARKMRAANIGTMTAGILQTSPSRYGGSIVMDMEAGSMCFNAGVSTRARKLLDRLRAGKFYPVWDSHGLNRRTPKAMQELIDAGLVGTAGRVCLVVSCYVPDGYTPYIEEKFPG